MHHLIVYCRMWSNWIVWYWYCKGNGSNKSVSCGHFSFMLYKQTSLQCCSTEWQLTLWIAAQKQLKRWELMLPSTAARRISRKEVDRSTVLLALCCNYTCTVHSVMEETGGNGVGRLMEATGAPPMVNNCFSLLRQTFPPPHIHNCMYVHKHKSAN